jgi:hypothetical protein
VRVIGVETLSRQSDVFNVGMLYWQMVTRDSKALQSLALHGAFALHRSRAVFTLTAGAEVLEGGTATKLQIPEDTPDEFVTLLKK